MIQYRFATALLCCLLFFFAENQSVAQVKPVKKQSVGFAETQGTLMQLPVIISDSTNTRQVKNRINKKVIRRVDTTAVGSPDAALYSNSNQLTNSPNSLQVLNAPTVSYDGITQASSGMGFFPPDVTGEIGPNHYVQAVNAGFAVFSRTGTILKAFTSMATLFSALGAPVGTRNDGDPVVLYDQLADRWIISQFAIVANPNYHQLIAVSKTSDPTGAYWLYDFAMPNNKFNDYGKFGMWPDAYYMTDNQFDVTRTTFMGAGAFAFDRTKMLVGDPTASYIYFDLSTGCPGGCEVGGMLPADLDGYTPPPVGTPCPFVYFDATEYGSPADRLRIFDFHVDFTTPANSTFTERTGSPLSVAAFDPREMPAGSYNNVPQSGTASKLDALGDRLMFRLGYRNLGSSEVLIANHTVNAAVNPAYRTGVRFYQLNRSSPLSAFTVTEQQTFDGGGDALYRWMASGAMNWQGDVAVGYSTSSSSTFPSIKYAARLGTDAPGTGLVQGEQNILTGTGSQTHTDGRWGDYSHISLDPLDDCSFWYTSEYFSTTSLASWKTRIVKFTPGTTTTSPRGSLTGTLTNCATGTPLVDASVTIEGGFFRQTVSGGTFTATLPPGTYTVTYSATNYTSVTTSVVIANGGTTYSNNCLVGVPAATAAGASLITENCDPANSGIDPNETVTVSFCVQNTGTAHTTNLVGTLLSTGGITNPGSAQTFGVVSAGGASVCRTFTFSAAGTCGGAITASIQFQDGAINLGTKTFTFTLGGPSTTTTTFSNATAVTIPTIGIASVYPSSISVSGITDPVTKVTVVLKNVTHGRFTDLDVLLVGPTGQKFTLLSDVSGSNITNQTFTIDDAASGLFPSAAAISTGSYRPTNYTAGDAFTTPAPTSPYQEAASAGSATFASMFNGLNPNGTWSLYILDDQNNTGGSMSGGWDLNITTSGRSCCIPACTPPSVDLTGPSSLCRLASIDLTGSPLDAGAGVVWLSSNSSVATVNTSGVITTVAGGITTITYQYTDGTGCTASISKLVTVNALPAANVTGTASVCYNASPVNITFTGSAGVAPYTFYYKINGGGTQNITTVSGNSIGVNVSTNIPGVYTYTLESVSDATGCSQLQSPSATIRVEDNTPPTLVCRSNQIRSANVSCVYVPSAGEFNPTAASDNCPGVVTSYTLTGATVANSVANTLNGITFNKGVTTVSWSMTDVANNTVNCNFNVTVNDNTAPSISCISNQIRAINAPCAYTAIETEFDFNASGDNCSGSAITYSLAGATTASNIPASSLNGVVFNKGVTTVTWKITDGSSNVTTCAFTVTVNDNVLPTITGPGNQTRSASSNCTYSPQDGEFDVASSGDNCPGAVLSYSLSGATTASNVVASTLNNVLFNKGSTTVTWRITDASGNYATTSFVVAVNDNTLPTIAFIADQTRSAGINCTYVVSAAEFDPSSSGDNCSGASRSYSLSGVTTAADVVANSLNGVVFNKGITTVTWKVTDASGNVQTSNFTVTVNDNTAPVITCIANQTRSADVNCSYTVINAEFDAVSASDNCTGAIINYSLSGATIAANIPGSLVGATFNAGITNVTWTITDASGSTRNCAFTVTINDNIKPVFQSCPGNITVYTGAGSTGCVKDVSWTVPVVTDNCPAGGSTALTSTHVPGSEFPIGTTNVTYTATDASGNIETCSFNVTVNDNTVPEITCAGNQVRSTNSGCSYSASAGEFDVATAMDNCTGFTLSYSLSGATNASNIIASSLNGIFFNKGVTTVTWKITDASANIATCNFVVTVNDNTVPVISCIVNQSRSAGVNCSYTASSTEFDAASSGDNCPGSTRSYSLSGATTASEVIANSLGGVVFNKGTTTITWKITDAAGNVANCTFNVTVNDNTLPTISCIANQTRSANSTCNYIATSAEFDIATSADNCSGSVISYSLTGATTASNIADATLNGVSFNKGVTTIIWKITDASSNIQTCSFTVTINDNTLPTITCITNQTRSAGVNCTYTPSSDEFDVLSSSDNCPGTSISYSLTGATTASNIAASSLNGVVFNEGATTVTWKITDGSSNIQTCSFIVTINDITLPTIACISNQTRSSGVNCTYSASSGEFDPASFADNCPGSVRSYTLGGVTIAADVTANSLNGVLFNKGVTTVTWKITDASGNQQTCGFTLTVIDNTVPNIVCLGNQTRSASTNCSYIPSAGEFDLVSSGDNCPASVRSYVLSGATTTNGIATTLNGVTFNKGITTVLWIITDASGNTATCNFTVTVNDNTPPVIVAATNQVRTASVNCTYAAASGEFDAVSSGDNCSGSFTSYSLTGATSSSNTIATTLNGVVFNKGVTTVIWKITDGSGNSATSNFNVTVNDNTLPAIVCQGNITRSIITGCTYSTSTGDFDSVSANDNCAVFNRSYTLTGATTGNAITNSLNGVLFNKGITSVTWVVTDASGNTASCNFNVTIADNILPVVIGPANQVRSANSSCTYISGSGEFDPLSTGDNCGSVVRNYTLTGATVAGAVTNSLNGVSFNKGLTTVKWSVTDASGNIATATFTVAINDNITPSVVCNTNQSRVINMPCAYIIIGNEFNVVSAADNCSGSILSYSLTGATTATDIFGSSLSGASLNIGITNVIWTITDASGNTRSCTFSITINDNIKPVLASCPSNITISAGAGSPDCFKAVSWAAPTVTDNCGSASLTSTHASGSNFPVGTTIVRYTATDGSGNTQTCSFNVTVLDNTAPVISCIANQVRAANSGCSYVPDASEFDPASATDNCSGYTLSYSLSGATNAGNVTASSLNGAVFNKGTTTVTWRITDASGNFSSCNFVVTVNDSQSPTILCSGNQTKVPNTASCSYVSTSGEYDPSASIGACPGFTLSYSLSGATTATNVIANSLNGVIFNKGLTNVTWTITNATGNTATCGFTISVASNLLGSISGTTAVAQNSSTTSTLQFAFTGGTAPYNFTYSIKKNNAAPVIYNGTAGGAVYNVIQSNATQGVYAYTLLTLTDQYGCPGVISSQKTATVTITGDPEDFTPTVDIQGLNFAAVGSSRDFIVNINEISNQAGSAGQLQFKIGKISAFNITYSTVNGISNVFGPVPNNNSDWTISENPFFITVTLKPLKQINANAFSKIGFTLTRKPGIAANTSQNLTVTIVSNTGGDSNPDNNTSNTVITAQ